MFNPTPHATRQLELISPGRWPKFASAEIISGESFPPAWQDSLITCDFRANRVVRFSLAEDHAGFVSKQEDDLLRTAAATFRPIDVKQGPDGALYIADWSNPIINHGEVDFRDERRDRWHGRIWRVTWKGAPKRPITDLTQLAIPELLDKLNSADRYTREQSAALLASRSDETYVVLPAWIARQTTDQSRLQALWLHEALNVVNVDLLDQLLGADDPGVRSAAVRVLSHWTGTQAGVSEPIEASKALSRYEGLVGDAHPRVRLEAVRGLASLGTSEAGKIALKVVQQPMDRFLDYALWLSVNELATPLSQDLVTGEAMNLMPPQHLEYLLTALGSDTSARLLDQYFASHEIPANGSGPWIELIGKAGHQQQLTQLFERVLARRFDQPASQRVLQALLDAERSRGAGPSGRERILELLARQDAPEQQAAIKLIGHWRLDEGSTKLLALASDTSVDQSLRREAILALRQIQKPQAKKALYELSDSIATGPLRQEVLAAIAAVDLKNGLPILLESMTSIRSEEEALAFWRSMLATKQAGQLIASSISGSNMPELVARAGLRVATEGRDEPELRAALLPFSGQLVTPESLTPERIAAYVADVNTSGDPHRGEEIYRLKDLSCVTCHAIGGVGGKVGPDMTSLGASAPLDYLVESIYNPNAKIKEGYHSVVLITEAGQVVTGIETKSDDAETIIRTADNKLITIPTREILEKSNGSSLMPAGVVDRLSKQDQLDLLAFLSRLGKPGDFDASRGGVARVYEVLGGTHKVEQGGTTSIIDGSLAQGWMPLQARVNGSVLGATLSEMVTPPSQNVALVNIYLRTRFQVGDDRPVSLTMHGIESAAVWIDGRTARSTSQLIDGKPAITVQAPITPGPHTLLLRLDARDVPEILSIRSSDVTFVWD